MHVQIVYLCKFMHTICTCNSWKFHLKKYFTAVTIFPTHVQGISGTGSLRIGSSFLGAFSGGKPVFFPRPTWGNHNPIFTHAGNKIDNYTYYDPTTCGFNAEGCFNDLKNNIPDGAVVMFHACAHNPTGVDPSAEQWKELSNICKQKGFTVYFDMAYQVCHFNISIFDQFYKKNNLNGKKSPN